MGRLPTMWPWNRCAAGSRCRSLRTRPRPSDRTERASVGRVPSAVITVDLYGETADYVALESLCRRFEVPLIEDSAEALRSDREGLRGSGPVGGDHRRPLWGDCRLCGPGIAVPQVRGAAH